jgi:NAD(P)-dependent dehydrogenase (short-subunit alcohol dehydrogenase family)
MELALTGKTAIVTGASRGIGLATVRRLAAEGVRVLGTARTVTAQLRAAAHATVAADLSTPGGAQTVVQTGLREFDAIDLLVNNAGGGDAPNIGGCLDLTDEDWQQLLELNLLGAVRVSRHALPSLIERRGAVVNVASIGAVEPAQPGLAYNTAKAALMAFSKGLATEVAPHGVRVNTVSPGPVRTAVWEGPAGLGARLADAAGVPQEAFVSGLPAAMNIPTGRIGEPDEVAALITFLLSPVAGSVTGSNHRIDGGLVNAC